MQLSTKSIVNYKRRYRSLVTERNPEIEKELVKGCKQGNEKSQYALYNKYSRAMYNLAFRMVNNRHDAEDLLQESFTEVFRKIGTYRFESTLGAWLKSIVINRCINHLRRNRPEILTDKPAPNFKMDSEPDNKPEYNIDKIFHAIEKLPDGYRMVLTLYLLEGYDHMEISEILGISVSTSKTQYMRAKKMLRQMLTKEEVIWIN